MKVQDFTIFAETLRPLRLRKAPFYNFLKRNHSKLPVSHVTTFGNYKRTGNREGLLDYI